MHQIAMAVSGPVPVATTGEYCRLLHGSNVLFQVPRRYPSALDLFLSESPGLLLYICMISKKYFENFFQEWAPIFGRFFQIYVDESASINGCQEEILGNHGSIVVYDVSYVHFTEGFPLNLEKFNSQVNPFQEWLNGGQFIPFCLEDSCKSIFENFSCCRGRLWEPREDYCSSQPALSDCWARQWSQTFYFLMALPSVIFVSDLLIFLENN